MAVLLLSKLGCCSSEMLPPWRYRHAQNVHGPSLGVTSFPVSKLGLCHTDAPTGKKGWHHIVSAREEEQSIDFGEKTAVSASWNIIKLYKNYKNIIKIICYTDARHPHQPMDTNEMTLIFMSKFAKNSVSTD